MSNDMGELNKIRVELLSQDITHAADQKELYYALCGGT